MPRNSAALQFATFVERLPSRCRFDAITFGHVILGTSEPALGLLREHERVHVRQYE